jgi:hypothetical protein
MASWHTSVVQQRVALEVKELEALVGLQLTILAAG